MKIIKFFKNIKKYWTFLWNDTDTNFIYVNTLLIAKLKYIEKYWGANTDYLGDYDDKIELQKLLLELADTTETINNSPNEKKNCKLNENIYKKVGRFLPRLW